MASIGIDVGGARITILKTRPPNYAPSLKSIYRMCVFSRVAEISLPPFPFRFTFVVRTIDRIHYVLFPGKLGGYVEVEIEKNHRRACSCYYIASFR